MITYLLKSSFLAAIFYLGYLMTARDMRFQYDRVYLLCSLLFSLVIPLIPFSYDFSHSATESHSTVLSVYENVLSSNETTQHKEGIMDTEKSPYHLLLLGAYFLGSFIMLTRFANNSLTLIRLLKSAEINKKSDNTFALVQENISPFTFWKYVVLNKYDFMNGKIDQRILLHEKAHVQNRHSYDILFIELLLIVFWFNPIIWLYNSVIRINHEYLADQQVIKSNDPYLYAYLLVTASQKNTISLFGSDFNYLLTKKRLLMMNRTKTSRLSFGYRLTGTLLIVISSFLTFSFKPIGYSGGENENFVVVIDAGHGGSDDGSFNVKSNLKEKDIILSISKAIEKYEGSKNISYVFTRQSDKMMKLNDRVQLADEANASLFLSLHINESTDANMSGIELYFSDENRYSDKSKAFCETFAKKVKINEKPSTIRSRNFFVSRKANCPTVMLELGFMSNEKDVEFLKSPTNQRKIANQINNAVKAISKL